MKWTECFTEERVPDKFQIGEYIGNPIWEDICSYLEGSYKVSARIEYSKCSGAPGWNVKYKKSGRALCTLYPDEGFYICLVSVGSKEADEAELLLNTCTEYIKELYWKTKPFNGSRWMMIEVRSPEILEDVKKLISLRVNQGKHARL